MTSKEWVVPPRPKPGRKPATDTPPTKRKAQNRAAQRAFRERRAARVGELEELLDQQQSAHEQEEEDMKRKIHELELEVQSFRSRCLLLESMLERERQDRMRAETRAESFQRQNDEYGFRAERLNDSRRGSYSQRRDSTTHAQTHSHIPERRHSERPHGNSFSITQIITPNDSESSLTCGNCSPSGPCACAEEALASTAAGCVKCGLGSTCQCLGNTAGSMEEGNDLKRPVSPSVPESLPKRHRLTSTANEDSEKDFSPNSTTIIAQQMQYQSSHPMAEPETAEPISIKDSCGFCNEGSYCACADAAAMATPAMTPTDTLPPVFAHQTQTPPPSEPDVVLPPIPMEMTADGAVKLPRRAPRAQSKPAQSVTSRGCGANGPGTCAQCQADPKSGLFCRLMAAKFDREGGGSSSGGCCGGKGAAGGCCKSKPEPKEKITLPSLPSLGLTCAEAYQTLSSHRNFEKAADDIGSWLPKLRATPRPGPRPKAPSMAPIEVEAASIMSVLKEFDVRFGREV